MVTKVKEPFSFLEIYVEVVAKFQSGFEWFQITPIVENNSIDI